MKDEYGFSDAEQGKFYRPLEELDVPIYYETNADIFVESTLRIDMQPLYQHFLPLLPNRAHILDVGCGSGRDSRYFISRGYRVTAFDASSSIAALAEQVVGQAIAVQHVQDIQYRQEFQGVWACASLLHVPALELPDVFHRLGQALTPHGVVYCSFKYGQGESQRGGRNFTDMDESALTDVVNRNGEMTIKELWITPDLRPGREVELWLNAILARMD